MHQQLFRAVEWGRFGELYEFDVREGQVGGASRRSPTSEAMVSRSEGGPGKQRTACR